MILGAILIESNLGIILMVIGTLLCLISYNKACKHGDILDLSKRGKWHER